MDHHIKCAMCVGGEQDIVDSSMHGKRRIQAKEVFVKSFLLRESYE